MDQSVEGVPLRTTVFWITPQDEHLYGCPYCGSEDIFSRVGDEVMRFCLGCKDVFVSVQPGRIMKFALGEMFAERGMILSFCEHPLTTIMRRYPGSFASHLEKKGVKDLGPYGWYLYHLEQLLDVWSFLTPRVSLSLMVFGEPEEIDWQELLGTTAPSLKRVGSQRQPSTVTSFDRRSRFPRGGFSSLAVNK